MELNGAEQRIRALFRELRIEDEPAVPRFAAVWNRAQSGTAERWTLFSPRFRVTATILVVCVALLSLVLLSRSWSRSQQPGGAVAKELVAPDASPAQVIKEQQPDKASVREQHDRSGRKPGFVRALARRQAAMVAAKQLTTRNAISISRWQSPTAGFLRSQSDELFRSLPQLNQSLREMESFLPNRLN